MRIFDIIIVIITIIIIISSIILFIYLNNKINDNNINDEINEKIKIMTSDIDINAKNIKSFKDDYERNNYKLDDGEVVIFTTPKDDIHKILNVDIIDVKVYGNYVNNNAILSTLPFNFKPRLWGNEYNYYIYGIKNNTRGAFYTAPYIDVDVNKSNFYGLVLLSELIYDNNATQINPKEIQQETLTSNTSFKYLQPTNEISESKLLGQNISYYKNKNEKIYDNDKSYDFKYLSSYKILDVTSAPLKLENKSYLITLKDIYCVYPGVIQEKLKQEEKNDK